MRTMIGSAARKRGTVTFKQLFSAFPPETPPSNVYDTLEEACSELGPWNEVIYSAVMAKAKDGLPGDGFFDIFKTHRKMEFRRIAGDAETLDLADEQRKQMTELERERVYVHASL
ncbi:MULTISPECIES: hypothetical protein [Burkholderia]|nr:MULTISPECIES: hypothetical protein [Burkholderia]MBR7900096.1 hypothetical protein [Burkholderia multivorans]MCA8337805.1 hypothetical protein [Burkholderia multivorans]HEM8497136.1 hypothetical protein [Burkholderia multivorans]